MIYLLKDTCLGCLTPSQKCISYYCKTKLFLFALVQMKFTFVSFIESLEKSTPKPLKGERSLKVKTQLPAKLSLRITTPCIDQALISSVLRKFCFYLLRGFIVQHLLAATMHFFCSHLKCCSLSLLKKLKKAEKPGLQVATYKNQPYFK